jgi:ribulose-5-phosphate 4-epimerase/fuculose-1-phosphate aldolase
MKNANRIRIKSPRFKNAGTASACSTRSTYYDCLPLSGEPMTPRIELLNRREPVRSGAQVLGRNLQPGFAWTSDWANSPKMLQGSSTLMNEGNGMNAGVLAAIRELVVANRILGNEGVVDAFGHISIRHPENPGHYFLACSRSPGLVTEDDIVEFDLDSNRLDGTSRAIYAERFIHGCLYKARPDVMSVCHSHAHAVVPFTVTNTPIEPIWVMASGSGPNVPNWDIRDEFPNEGTMLVVNDATGQSLAKKLGAGRVCLLRGHGAVIATSALKATVMVSIGLMCNAAMLIQAHTLSQGRGDAAVKHLSPAEIEATSKILLGPLGLDRAWEYWRVRAGYPPKEE